MLQKIPLTSGIKTMEDIPHYLVQLKSIFASLLLQFPQRVFSTAGDIVTAQRSQLKSKNFDRLIFLKNNWNTSKFMNSKESDESLGRDETPRHVCHQFFTSI